MINNEIGVFNELNGFGEYKKCATELMKIFFEILDKYGVDYFLISGTLLGQVRHNDFIPWDDDIDIIVSKEFTLKYDEIEKEILSKELQFYVKKKESMYKIHFKDKYISNKKGPWMWPFIDIFIYGNNKNKTIKFFNREWTYDNFFPKQNVFFNGINVSIPKNPDYFLSINYGKQYMNILKSSNYDHKNEKSIRNVCKIEINVYNKLLKEN